MAKDLNARLGQFRESPSSTLPGPFTFVTADALVLKVREGGRVVPVPCLVATGADADGHRQVLGGQVTTARTAPAGWRPFVTWSPAVSKVSEWSSAMPRRSGRCDHRNTAWCRLATLTPNTWERDEISDGCCGVLDYREGPGVGGSTRFATVALRVLDQNRRDRCVSSADSNTIGDLGARCRSTLF